MHEFAKTPLTARISPPYNQANKSEHDNATGRQAGKDNNMKYMIVYCKTTPAISYRNTIEAAQALAQQFKRCGYTVEIWEQGTEGARPIR